MKKITILNASPPRILIEPIVLLVIFENISSVIYEKLLNMGRQIAVVTGNIRNNIRNNLIISLTVKTIS